jgi:hypothetical protein
VAVNLLVCSAVGVRSCTGACLVWMVAAAAAFNGSGSHCAEHVCYCVLTAAQKVAAWRQQKMCLCMRGGSLFVPDVP